MSLGWVGCQNVSLELHLYPLSRWNLWKPVIGKSPAAPVQNDPKICEMLTIAHLHFLFIFLLHIKTGDTTVQRVGVLVYSFALVCTLYIFWTFCTLYTLWTPFLSRWSNLGWAGIHLKTSWASQSPKRRTSSELQLIPAQKWSLIICYPVPLDQDFVKIFENMNFNFFI